MYTNVSGRAVSKGCILLFAGWFVCTPAICNAALYGDEDRFRNATEDPSDTTGLQYAYYEGVWAALPDFATLTPVEEGTVSAPTLAVRHRETDFGIRFTGQIDITTEGVHTFYINSDDGSRLLIDNKVVVSNDTLHEERERSGKINLTSGKHAITILYFQHHSLYALSVSYAGPGLTKQVIPPGHFSRPNTGSAVKLEAETAMLSGVKIMRDYAGYTGSGFVNYQNNSWDFIRWTAYVPTAGTYKLTFRYALADAARSMNVTANDKVLIQSLNFPSTSGWANWSTISVFADLVAGLNTISVIAAGSSGPHMDHLVIENMPNFVTGNEENADTKSNLSVYPNPAAQRLFVDLASENDRSADVSLLNAQGNAITTQRFNVQAHNTTPLALDVSTFSNGMYILRVKRGEKTEFRNVIILK